MKAAATHEHYKSCVAGTSQENVLQLVALDSINAHQHEIYTVRKQRIMYMVGNADNTRVGLDTVHFLPYGFKCVKRLIVPAIGTGHSTLMPPAANGMPPPEHGTVMLPPIHAIHERAAIISSHRSKVNTFCHSVSVCNTI